MNESLAHFLPTDDGRDEEVVIGMVVGGKIGAFVGWLSIEVGDLSLNDGSSADDEVL